MPRCSGAPLRPAFVPTILALCILAPSRTASAGLTNTFVQVGASASELSEAGYTQLGSAPYVSLPSGECAVNGCVTLAGAASGGIAKGFLEFQFLDYTYNPVYDSGLFVTLDVDFGSSGTTLSQLIALINAQTATTGVTALTTAQANNAQGTSAFDEWLPTDLLDALVLNWTPSSPPTSPGLSQVFRFAWDFTGVNPAFAGGGVTVDGAYGLPAPGALALLALGGVVRGRRR